MKMFNRILKSVISLKKRTMILSALFLVVTVFLISGSAVQGSLNKVINKNQEKVNSIVSIEKNLDAMMKGMNDPSSGGDSGTDKKKVDSDLVEKVKGSKYVENYSVQSSTNISTQFVDESMKENMPDGVPEGTKIPDTKLNILDSTNTQISEANINLVDGEFSFESKKKRPVMVSQGYADNNKVKIGGKIDVQLPNMDPNADPKAKSKVLKANIVGIYELNNNNPEKMGEFQDKTIYTTKELVDEYNNIVYKDQDSPMIGGYNKIKVELTKPEYADKFIKEMKKGDGDFSLIEFKSSFGEFKSVSDMIDNIISLFTTLKMIIFIVAAVIIGLIMLLSLRERKKEIGLLLSLGAKKRTVISQMFFEVAIVLVATFVIGFSISTFVVTPYVNAAVNEKMTTTMSENDSSNTQVARGGNFIEDESTKLDADTKIDNTSEIDYGSALIIFLITLGITALSTIIPTMRIVSRSPKEILSSTE